MTNAGSITVDEHAQLLLNGGDTIDNTAGGSITVDHLATLTLTGIDTITGGGSLTNSGTISVAGTVSIGNETLTNNANGSIIVGTTGGAADTLTLTSATVTNAGTLTVEAGGALTLTGDLVEQCQRQHRCRQRCAAGRRGRRRSPPAASLTRARWT